MLKINELSLIYQAILDLELASMTTHDDEPRCLLCGGFIHPAQDFRDRYQQEHGSYCPIEVAFHGLWKLFHCKDLPQLATFGNACLSRQQLDFLAKCLVGSGCNTKKDAIVTQWAMECNCSQVVIHQQLKVAGYM